MDALPYVMAHPGKAASMGVCVLDGGSPCDEAFAADRRVAVTATQAVREMGHLDAGTYRIRVALDNAAGQRVLTSTGELVVHYTDGGRCKNMVGNHGTSRVDARGRIRTT
ncbi:hypothetical protein [Streptomyces sp. NPDC020917]|uniref:hypothetical protein n=1 Tax=Streptomyces sp. NPDC020917 TaxID=3365102 RepID=UPI0037BAC0AE